MVLFNKYKENDWIRMGCALWESILTCNWSDTRLLSRIQMLLINLKKKATAIAMVSRFLCNS